MASPDPIRDDELAALFRGIDACGRVGVAVSGGPDSTALAVLLSRWASTRGRLGLHVLTVDHGLRAGSAADCDAVAAVAARLGHPHSVLAWDHVGEPPRTGIQAAARDARYRLLAGAARSLGLDAVALAHTLDDKAETLLLRLARGSGLTGLAAMATDRIVHGVRFHRPLLGVAKSRLKATLRRAGIGWVEDPANTATDRFSRARIRSAMPLLADLGLTAARLAETADRLAAAAAAIDATTAALAEVALTDHGGVVSVDAAALAAAADEVAFRLMVSAHGRVRPSEHGPRAAAIEAILGEIRKTPAGPLRRTAGGVVFDLRQGRLWLYAEAGRKGFPTLVVERAGTHFWDDRFEVKIERPLEGPVAIGAALGDERRPDLPKSAAGSLPVVRRHGDDRPLDGEQSGVILRPVTQV